MKADTSEELRVLHVKKSKNIDFRHVEIAVNGYFDGSKFKYY